MTYNQASYIEDALNGFCMQETGFPFVCVICDDASTDGEPGVIRNYLERNFELEDQSVAQKEETVDYNMIFLRHKTNINCYFAVYFLKYNHWGKKDKAPYYAKHITNSKYIAICEGDDYWFDSQKLQKQVDFMETHPDYALCYTKAKRECNGKILGMWGDADFTFEGLLNGSIIPTLTRLERKSSYENFLTDINPYNHHWLMGDYANVLYYSLMNKIGYLEGASGVYRVLGESTSHSNNINKLLRFYDSADDIRYFFINNYIKETDKKRRLLEMIKRNGVIYKLDQYTKRYMIKEAVAIYKTESVVLPRKKRIIYWLETFSEVASPVFICFFNIRRNIKQIIKKIYISI